MYAANVACAGMTLTLTWVYAASHGFVEASIAPVENRRIVVRQLLIPAIFLASIAAEYAAPSVYLGPYTLIAIAPGLWIVDRVFRSPPQPGRAHGLAKAILWRAGTVIPWLLIIGLAWYIAA